MDLALDDIIKNKNVHKTGIGARIKNNSKKFQKSPPKHAARRPIVDARLKIIQKNRLKIRDARDKLAEITRASGDARKKLVRKQLATDSSQLKLISKQIARNRMPTFRFQSRTRVEKPIIILDSPPRKSSYHVLAPRGYVDYDNMQDIEEEEALQLSRTVKNDMARYPSSSLRRTSDERDAFDPFDVYEVQQQPRIERKTASDYEMHELPREVIRREVSNSYSKKHYLPESSKHLSYEMRSRLEHAPDPHASMGIFANSRGSPERSNLDSRGYRIVVSNLHSNVSQLDIKELFEDIGELYDSRIVRPGVAEVIYKKLADAELAVETYHNRQLDGQPMKCLLVNPRTSYKSTSSSSASSIKKPNKTPLEIDIDALHKVLFRRN